MTTLRAGDCVRTKGMTDEQYHDVCQSFIDAGAAVGEYSSGAAVAGIGWEYVGWDKCGNYISHWDDADDFSDSPRVLSVDEVLQGGNDCTGPADGLPPVGTVCEGYVPDALQVHRWMEVEILKHQDSSSGECAVHLLDLGILRWCDQFRPLKSDRERAIDEMALHVSNSSAPRCTAADLYDAGYRKTEGAS